jgi:hypothetical protein
MREKMKPASKKQAPDPSRSYERSHPQDEAGMGRLHAEPTTPSRQPDRAAHAATNRRNQSKGRRNRP